MYADIYLLSCVKSLFQNELKEKDLAIRKFEQEIDSLSFRNNQLSMRVNVLQQELDETHARSKKHKVGRYSLDHAHTVV